MGFFGAATTQVVDAQAFTAFDTRPATELVVPAFTDAEVNALLGTLDRLLAAKVDAKDWRDRATDSLWQFARRIQAGRLSAAQEVRILKHLDAIATSRPEAPAAVAGPRRMIKDLTVGKVAPDIAAGQIVAAHLGSGASLCAIRGGRSVETTMGFTALDGLPMSTRPGQLDAGVVPARSKRLAMVSLLCWFFAIIAGRLIAYVGPVPGL